MNEPSNNLTTRREFLKSTSRLAAVSTVAGAALTQAGCKTPAQTSEKSVPHVHVAHTDLIQVALVGCGGRGGGAADNALQTTIGPVKLVAMADVFEHRLN